VNGYIAEVVVFNTALSTTDRARVEAYLAAKWGISGVHAQATATNDPVGYWRDKSGNNRHATQATGASRPLVRGVTINGRRNIDFDGTDDNLWLAPAPTGDNLTALCVYRYDTLGGVAFDVTHQGDATNASRTESTGFLNSIGLQTNAIGVIAHRLDSARAFTTDATGRSSAVGAYAVGRVAISSAAASFGTTTTGRYGGVDGASLSETTRFNGGVWSAVSLGCRRNSTPISTGSVFMDGQLCEVLLYERNLPAAERQRLERYLAAKWGIALAPQVSNADAQDWVNRVYAAGSTVSQPVATAVSNFVDGCVADGIWTAMKSVVLLAGADTLAGALVPLKGAAPTNLNFVSGDYNRQTGLVGDASTKHLNANRNANADPQNNFHMSVFVGAPIVTGSVSFGAGGASSGSTQVTTSVWRNRNSTASNFTTTGTQSGLFGMSRSSSSEFVGRNNGTSTTFSVASETPFNGNIFIYARNSGGAGIFGNMRASFYSIGESLDLALLDSRVSSLMTAIGAAIP
jgi:hypothetical protein